MTAPAIAEVNRSVDQLATLEPLQTQSTALPMPSPLIDGISGEDALARLLMAMELQQNSTLKMSASDIANAQDRLRELQQELFKQLQEALRAARAAPSRSESWFNRTFGGVVDTLASALGKVVEFHKDMAWMPADMTESTIRNAGNRQALMNALQQDVEALREDGYTAQAVEGFVSGTSRFAADLGLLHLTALTALVRGAQNGDSLVDILKSQGSEVWDSFIENIWENPDFWFVAGKIAEAIAVVVAVVSWGTLAAVAIALIVLIEANERYGLAEEVVGKEKAPYVDIGLRVAAAVVLAVAGGGGSGVDSVQALMALLSGVRGVVQGVETIQEANRQAGERDAEADVQQTMNQIQQMQRFIEELIELYGERNEDHTSFMESATQLVATEGAIERAAVVRA
jgi:NAD(P)H-dependent FMN reductase